VCVCVCARARARANLQSGSDKQTAALLQDLNKDYIHITSIIKLKVLQMIHMHTVTKTMRFQMHSHKQHNKKCNLMNDFYQCETQA